MIKNSIIQEKVKQAVSVLREKKIDLWITFVRETSAGFDPVLPMIFGKQTLTWESALMVSSTGETICILGNLDKTLAKDTGAYTQLFWDMINRLNLYCLKQSSVWTLKQLLSINPKMMYSPMDSITACI